MSRVLRIGERAREALARSRGAAEPLPGFAEAPYYAAAGELIWVGARLPAMHPRAVITAEVPCRGAPLQLSAIPARGWRPARTQLDAAAAARIVDLTRTLLAAETPHGFGALLANHKPAFPLDLAVERVQALARAYLNDAPESVRIASIALLGLGAGLTPSGDDLVGAALFARRLLAPQTPGWDAVAEQLAAEAGTRSHAISAALFDDLARGESFAPLHDIVDALAADDQATALAAARALTAIGHSSGWDMYTGLAIGLTGDCAS